MSEEVKTLPMKKKLEKGSLGERLWALRKSQRLSQSAFAERLGLKQSIISYWESGAREPNEAMLDTIANEFGCDKIWLQSGTAGGSPEEDRKREIQKIENIISRMTLKKLIFARKWLQLTVGTDDSDVGDSDEGWVPDKKFLK